MSIDGSRFVNPLDSFIEVVPATSRRIAVSSIIQYFHDGDSSKVEDASSRLRVVSMNVASVEP